MRVLVGCECSQTVVAAFRRLGVEAFSCDLAKSYGDYPEYHFQGDLREVYSFVNPDLFIAHPPCTFLSRAGLNRLVDSSGKIKDWVRYEKGLLARDFFLWCLSRPAKMLCVENPVPIRRFGLPVPSQYIEPFYFGDPYSKHTALWLRGLPLLLPSKVLDRIRGDQCKAVQLFTGETKREGRSNVGLRAANRARKRNLSEIFIISPNLHYPQSSICETSAANFRNAFIYTS